MFASGLILTALAAQDVPKPPATNPPDTGEKGQSGIQVENRGPVHEAFANPGAAVRGDKEGFTAPKAPPPPVPELPPDEKPSGNDVQWIPGYWQFDQEKKDFIWVSGFWRNTPPGRAWSPGEWRVENGTHRYIPGYWKPSNENSWRIDLPKPPESVEAGPNIPAPHKDAHWIPGHWVHRDDNYVWRPGYWGEIEDGMIWTPSQYLYTGSGYRFVPGYWDYCFEDRGLLYAPVYFTSPLWLNPGWRFCPSFGISIGFGGGWGWGYGGFYDNLYIGPGFGCYWFGNFGGPWFWGAGYRPWCWTGGRGFCNPNYHNYCWLNRQNQNWHHNTQQHHAARTAGVIPGPGRNVARNNPQGRGNNINPAALNNATNLVSKIGGEQAGRNLADRVNKGQMIQDANRALKQAGSNNIVQPAREVLRNQTVARNLPAPSTTSTARTSDLNTSIRNATLSSSGKTSLDSMRTSSTASRTMNTRPTYAGNEAALRNQINNAVRSAPTGTITRSEATRNLPSSSNNLASRNMNSLNTMRGSSRGMENAMRGSDFSSSAGRGFANPSTMGRSFSQPNMGSSAGRSFSNPSMGGYAGGSRSFGGASGGMGGARGMGGGGMGGGSRGGGGGGGGKR